MKHLLWLSILGLTVCTAPFLQARSLKIKMGTVAPQGSIWHKALLEMAEVFAEETGGKVQLKIYAGVVGDEPTIVRKMRIGQLQAATLTNTGLALITTEPLALQLPMQFENHAELDAVMAGMEPLLDQALEDDGFINLTWSDGGWVYFFTKNPSVSLADVKNTKMWMWAHDPGALKSFEAVGFSPVVLSGVDILPSLQTGMIEVFPTTPISALALRTYPLTPHMIDVKWGVMLGGTIISSKAWQKIPAEARSRIRQRCKAIGKKLTINTRRDAVKAIEIMKGKGLQVHTPNTSQMNEWRTRAIKSRAMIRGGSVDAQVVDRAMQLLEQYRKKYGAKATP